MPHAYWNDWSFAWGWFLWISVIVLLFASFGNWGYTYRAHQKYGRLPSKAALDVLNERYARGEIKREEHSPMKSERAKT